MRQPYTILVVDNETKMCDLIAMALEPEGYEITVAHSGKEALEKMSRGEFQIVISDLKMSPVDGLQLLEQVKQLYPETEFILMTAFASQETALKAMKIGAYDYLIKPFEMDELVLRVQRLKNQLDLKQENRTLKNNQWGLIQYDQIIGKSNAMQKVYSLIEKVKNTDATVLIRGESGTGKELIARVIHDKSKRKNFPFIAVNCAAMPETLLESELFGHAKGAFTGAHKDKPGKFQLADKGSLFLDEIGELTLETQAKLLRVLQDKTFYPVGGLQAIQVETRIIAATNRPLEEMVKQGQFREDLYYRLQLFPIHIPPLRDRKEDIPELIWFFLKDMGNIPIDKAAMQDLMEYNWPGNVRQLQNVLYRAGIIAEDVITPDDLPDEIYQISNDAGAKAEPNMTLFNKEEWEIPPGFNLDLFEAKLIRTAVEQAEQNKTRAAQLLGVTRRRLYSLMQKHNISLGEN